MLERDDHAAQETLHPGGLAMAIDVHAHLWTDSYLVWLRANRRLKKIRGPATHRNGRSAC
jgi:predicted TIM-barrel fold metal-dependent hydrolase